MLFNSLPFFCFLIIGAVLFFSLPIRQRPILVLGLNYIFYATYGPQYLPVLILITFFGYIGGLLCSNSLFNINRKRPLLLFFVALHIGSLGLFKYVQDIKAWLANALPFSWASTFETSHLDVLLPIGISFFTFQSLAYVIDVYRYQTQPEKNLFRFALFISYFPQLVSGPIERANHLIPQLGFNQPLDAKRIHRGILMISSGLFKKAVVANTLAPVVFFVLSDPHQFNGLVFVLMAIYGRYMIYADFSGYTDMAIGISEIFGVKLHNNFNRPFFSRSLTDYWRRWHITLGHWMRDYVFTSLATTKLGHLLGIPFCIFVTFLLLGLWHEVSWSFFLVGVWHGFFVAFETITATKRQMLYEKIGLTKTPRLLCFIQWTFTMVVLVSYPTIFFLSDISTAVFVTEKMTLSFFKDPISWWDISHFLSHSQNIRPLLTATIFIIIIELLHWLQIRRPIRERLTSLPGWLQFGIYIVMTFVFILFYKSLNNQAYIYYQF